jgi:hypothetical protein
MKSHCCPYMHWQLTKECPDHPRPSTLECDEYIMGQFEDGSIGIYVHDGGSSMVIISFCPWCGTKL